MKPNTIALIGLLGMLSVQGAPAIAADPDALTTREQAETQQRIYGSQLMTQKERNAYRSQMRAAKTEEERLRIRESHHEAMQKRAKARGVTLPDEPPSRGRGLRDGSGMGRGNGMGSGNGMMGPDGNGTMGPRGGGGGGGGGGGR